jgi:MurNAc alpha-1-phosphate uridylyltransferase
MIKSALIFAAGRGERLRPLTDVQPKPLCRLSEELCLLDRTLQNLALHGIETVVINHAYLGSMIRRHLKRHSTYGLNIYFSPEPPGALETAGAIVQALPWFGQERFLTISADILTDYPYQNIQVRADFPIHLVLVPQQSHTPQADFGLDDQGRVTNEQAQWTFGNIACFDPVVFRTLPLQRLKLAHFLRAQIQRHQVSGELYTGPWFDTGDIQRLNQAQQFLAQT